MKPDQTKVDPVRRGAKKKPLIGAVKPRIHSPLLKGASRIDEVADLAEKIGMPLLPWQHFVLEDMLKVDKDGMFVRKTTLNLVARQSGKTHLARMRILAGLFLFDEKNIIAMSSNRNMALDTLMVKSQLHCLTVQGMKSLQLLETGLVVRQLICYT